MQKVYMPADFCQTVMFGAEAQKDEGGKFLVLNENCAEIAVKSYGGTIAEPAAAPAAEIQPDPAPVADAPAEQLAEPAAAPAAPSGGAAQ